MATTPTTGNDTITGSNTLNDNINSLAGNDTIYGLGGNDTLNGDLGNDYLDGGIGNDSLIGGEGDDTLLGGTGDDALIGGDGNDVYYVDSYSDAITESSGGTSGYDKAYFNMLTTGTVTLANNVEEGYIQGTLAVNLTGNASDNYLAGNTVNNTLNGDVGNDTLFGDAGNDSLIGGTGNDSLNGGTGADTMYGGANNDIYVVDNLSDVVSESTNGTTDDGGTDTVQSSVTFTLGNFIENLTLTGTDAINGTGNALNNTLTGNGNDNYLNGGTGADTLNGAGGNDTYVVNSSDDVVNEALNMGDDTVLSYVSTYTLTANVENMLMYGSAITANGNDSDNAIAGNAQANIIHGGKGADALYGGGGNDAIYGEEGNDDLSGDAGADSMYGGSGNDTYHVDNLGDVVSESLNGTTDDGGVDTVESSLSTYTLGTYVENLTLTGSDSLEGVGNTLNNIITGNSGDNVLVGGGGADTLIGGNGADTYLVDSLDDVVTENAGDTGEDLIYANVNNYTLADNVETLMMGLYTSPKNANGNGTANTIVGNFQDNIIHAGGGNDTISSGTGNDLVYGDDGADVLIGGAGTDTMYGGAGNDVYGVDNQADVAIEIVGGVDSGGFDTVESTANSYTLAAGIENLELYNLAVTGVGNDLNNTLTGNEYDNQLDGSTGADTLIGGLGNDAYYIDNLGDIVQEGVSEGTNDVIVSTIGFTLSTSLGSNIESVYLAGNANLNVQGDASDNVIFGNTGANSLTGGNGNDLLVGFRDVTVARGLSTPVAYGSVDGNDTLDGGAGDDTLDGGAGNDVLIGGTGNDYYIVDSANDAVQEADTLNGGAWDVVEASVDYSLSASSNTAGVEGLLLTGSAVSGKGNALANGITGTDSDNLLYGYDGNDTIYGMDGVDYIYGGNGNDVLSGDQSDDLLSGGAGDDQLEGGTGNDTLQGSTGNDTYNFYADFGSDLLINSTSNGAGETDEVYLADASSDQIWLSRVGDDLMISQVNTSDAIQVQNWFLGVNYQVDHIFTLADGKELDAQNVNNLVNAMASFAPQDMSAPNTPTALLNAKNAAWINL